LKEKCTNLKLEYSEYAEELEIIEGLYEITIPTMFYNSFIIYLYGCSEATLLEYARCVHKSELEHKDSRNLKSIRKRILSDSQIDIGKKKNWDHLLDLYRIRNCLVHRAGVIEDKSKKSIDAIVRRARGQISIWPSWNDPSPEIRLSYEYCETSYARINGFFEDLWSALDLRTTPTRAGPSREAINKKR
jgi:hypothetical protein